jgi:hypothetical protein
MFNCYFISAAHELDWNRHAQKPCAFGDHKAGLHQDRDYRQKCTEMGIIGCDLNANKYVSTSHYFR